MFDFSRQLPLLPWHAAPWPPWLDGSGQRSPSPAPAASSSFFCRHGMICVATTILAGLPTSFQRNVVGSPAKGKGELGGLFGADYRVLGLCLMAGGQDSIWGTEVPCSSAVASLTDASADSHLHSVTVLCRISGGLAVGPVSRAGTLSSGQCHLVSWGPRLASLPGRALPQGVH